MVCPRKKGTHRSCIDAFVSGAIEEIELWIDCWPSLVTNSTVLFWLFTIKDINVCLQFKRPTPDMGQYQIFVQYQYQNFLKPGFQNQYQYQNSSKSLFNIKINFNIKIFSILNIKINIKIFRGPKSISILISKLSKYWYWYWKSKNFGL